MLFLLFDQEFIKVLSVLRHHVVPHKLALAAFLIEVIHDNNTVINNLANRSLPAHFVKFGLRNTSYFSCERYFLVKHPVVFLEFDS